MESEYAQVLTETAKAKKSMIANTAGFGVGLLVTVLTYISPSPVFLVAWGAIIFCPIAALRSYSKYKRLKGLLSPRV